MHGSNVHDNQGTNEIHLATSVGALITRLMALPLIGPILFIVPTAVVVIWLATNPSTIPTRDVALLVALSMAVSGSRMWPVRVGKATRLYVASVPLYLLSCLFAPPVASAAVGMGMLGREVSTVRECRNRVSTLCAQVGRWMLLSFVASALLRAWPSGYLAYAAFFAAAFLWAGDLLTCPLVFAPITGAGAWETIVRIARQSYTGEMMQYLIAMLTLLLFGTGILWTGILWVDVLAVLMVVLPIVLLYLYLKGEDASREPSTSASTTSPSRAAE